MAMIRGTMLVGMVSAGCGDGGGAKCLPDTASSCDSGLEADADSDADADADADADSDADADAEFTVSVGAHPCAGNRTDALWMDSSNVGYVGCGTTVPGVGLFTTEDGGREWLSVGADADGTGPFDAYRVNHVWRDPGDGNLYVSGNHTETDARVVSVGVDGSIANVWSNGTTYDYSFTVGSYAAGGDVAVAESLTGNGLVIAARGGAWVSGYGWWTTAGFDGLQILDLVAAGESIVGVGSTIGHPPVVYLPPRAWSFATLTDDGYMANLWEVVLLADGVDSFNGELWDVDADSEGRLVAGGVNQDLGEGVVFSIGSDWATNGYEQTGWTAVNVGDVLGRDDPTWVRGVCRDGQRVVAVGEYSRRSDGFVLLSTDGGTTFKDQTESVFASMPEGSSLGALHRCQFADASTLAVAGADGTFIRFSWGT